MFVGREQETRWMVRALAEGTHAVLSGKYGIGRTTLVQRLAAVSSRDRIFAFLDASQPPAALCRTLYSQLPMLSRARSTARGPNQLAFRTLRYRVLNARVVGQRPVLVWDNIARLSHAKIDLLKRLVACGRFLIIAVVEEFLPPGELKKLRTILAPAPVLKLSYLPPSDAREFFLASAAQLGHELTDDRLKQLVALAHGYPLEMARQAARLSGHSGPDPITAP
jgi:replication-associated recombination protein RarA